MPRLISLVLADSSRKACEEDEKLQNKTILAPVGLDPTSSRLLDWRSNQMRFGTAVIVDTYR